MSDPNQEFPLDMDILQSMVTWQDNADYAFCVNGFGKQPHQLALFQLHLS